MNLDLILISFFEGLTEFLPISSTAHIIIASKLFGVDTTDAYIKFYLLFIQFGALLAGLIIFFKRIISDKKLIINIIISFLPSAAIGFVLYKTFKHLLEGNMILLAVMLFLGALVFIYLEKVFIKKQSVDINEFGRSEITKKDALIVGIAQAVAIIPGVSRSGATIIAGVFRSIKKAVIFEYTFILALPTLFAAVLYDAYKSYDLIVQFNSYSTLAIGFIVAFLTASVTLYVVRKHLPHISLTFFAWYRIIAAILVLIVFV